MQSQKIEEFESLAADVFGHATLRPEQRRALELICRESRCLVTLPTGAGKSLLYGLTALTSEGVTIVVSPLTALKREQTRKFLDRGVPSAFLAFDQSFSDKAGAWTEMENNRLKLLFVSPERFVSGAFRRRLRSLQVARVFIDEAHCVASWGFDFRPEYREVGRVLRSLDVKEVVALTATASAATRRQISRVIALPSEKVAEQLSDPLRQNVRLEAVRVKGQEQRLAWLSELISQMLPRQKVIVYVQRRKDAESLARHFKSLGQSAVKPVCYHAGLGSKVRKSLEDYIACSSEALVIFATQAFGMGIDLPDVNRVVVHGFPGGIEDFLQMAGRAGRAGQAATSTLLWIGSDPVKRSYGLKKSFPEPSSLRRCLSFVFKKVHQAAQAQPQESGLIFALKLEQISTLLEQHATFTRGETGWTAESLANVVRLSPAVHWVPASHSVVLFTARSWKKIFKVQEELSGHDNQRARTLAVFSAALEESSLGEERENARGLQWACLDLYQVQSETRLSLSQLERVFAHFNAIEGLSCRLFSSSGGDLLLPREALEQDLPVFLREIVELYSLQRGERFAGFEALESFARTDKCRMRPISKYLETRRTADCGQCDFCANRGERVLGSSEIC